MLIQCTKNNLKKAKQRENIAIEAMLAPVVNGEV